MLLLLMGCAKKNETKTAVPEPITFRLFNIDGGTVMWNDPVAAAITESTGVTLDMEYPQGNGSGQISLMIATSDYPDLIYAKGDAGRLIANGALIDLRELIEEYGPNIKKLYGDKYQWLSFSNDDPAIYQLCSSALTDGGTVESGSVQMQFALLKENGWKLPHSLEEYERMLKDYMARYPEIDGRPVIGISMSCSDWRWMITMGNPSAFISDGTVDNGQWLVDEKLNMMYKHRSQGQKEFYRWLNRMYQEGVLDPEFATQTYENYLEKIAQGRVLSIMDQKWEYGDSITKLLDAGKEERTYAQIPLTADASIPYHGNLQSGQCAGWGIGITKACRDPVRAIQFIDYLCSDEGQILLNWGILDVNYYLDEDGKRCRTQEEILREQTDITYRSSTGVGRHAFPFPVYPQDARDENGDFYSPDNSETKQLGYSDIEREAARAWGVDNLSEILTSGEEWMPDYPAVWSLLLSSTLESQINELNLISWDGLVECVICESESFDDCWERYQRRLLEAGVEDIEQEMTGILKERAAFYQ